MPLPRAARRLITALLCAGLFLLSLYDLATVQDPQYRWIQWLPFVSGPVVAVALLYPSRRPGIAARGAAAAALSLALTVGIATSSRSAGGTWGLVETVVLLILLARAVRQVERPAAAVVVSTALAAAVITLPWRVSGEDPFAFSFILTFLAAAPVGLGCYLRLLDARRARAVVAVREGERLALARELHDFVAHHVTGIIVHANAALMIQQTDPQQVTPLLEGISRAGSETLDSMRRLVRVLREEDTQTIRPGEVLTELARLVSSFSGDGTDARLEAAAAVRDARLAPEVETSVHRVVQEALTNVRRHAHGCDVAVRIDVDGERLRVEVRNSAPPARVALPVGGRGGFGLVGLRERVEAVEGTLDTGPTPDGGWCVRAAFPTLTAVAA